MEDIKNVKSHKLILNNRMAGSLTGIKKVISFDTDEVILLTEQGNLMIKGKELHVTRLDVEKGELEFEGLVDSFFYARTKSQSASGIVGRLFK